MTLTDFLQPLDLDTHIRMAEADADLIYFGPAGDLPLPVMQQKNGWPFCPRCGKPLKIDPQTQRAASSNALSREVSGLYICDDCGSDEALRAFAGLPLPLEEWEQTRLINSMYK